ncbi:hypothetical protein M8I35_15755 [Micromonospora sp. MSM11]|nr:hypothetical protein [Micromonospora sp. MSM11]MCL7458635.1 hypothetical protein [Micromonospora sp. MSM11]
MVTGPIQQPPTLPGGLRPPAARRPAVTGLGDLHPLARALAAAPAEPRWRERLLVGLGPVRRSFAEHVRVTEGPAGLYAELLGQAPRLARGVRLLAREHVVITAALAALQHAVEAPDASVDDLLGRAGHLLRALAGHRQRGADLLWEAYETDLGGET